MKRVVLFLLSTVAVIAAVLGYRTSTGDHAAGATANPAPSPDSASPTPVPGGVVLNGTFTGAEAWTPRGPVQVRITVIGGAITDVAVPVHPTGHPRDAELNTYAIPLLQQETLAAQGAGIDTVSGATVTSKGYIQSLQSALDAAHRG